MKEEIGGAINQHTVSLTVFFFIYFSGKADLMEYGSRCHGHMTLTENACRCEMTGTSALHSTAIFSF